MPKSGLLGAGPGSFPGTFPTRPRTCRTCRSPNVEVACRRSVPSSSYTRANHRRREIPTPCPTVRSPSIPGPNPTPPVHPLFGTQAMRGPALYLRLTGIESATKPNSTHPPLPFYCPLSILQPPTAPLSLPPPLCPTVCRESDASPPPGTSNSSGSITPTRGDRARKASMDGASKVHLPSVYPLAYC